MSGRVDHRADQRGQVTVMIIGLVVVLVMMVAVVVDASTAYLRRQALSTLADGAALAAADGIEGEQVYRGGLGERGRIDPGRARVLTEAYLSSVDARRRYPGLGHAVVTSGDRVVVRLTAPLDLPLPLPGVQNPHISAESASVVAISD